MIKGIKFVGHGANELGMVEIAPPAVVTKIDAAIADGEVKDVVILLAGKALIDRTEEIILQIIGMIEPCVKLTDTKSRIDCVTEKIYDAGYTAGADGALSIRDALTAYHAGKTVAVWDWTDAPAPVAPAIKKAGKSKSKAPAFVGAGINIPADTDLAKVYGQVKVGEEEVNVLGLDVVCKNTRNVMAQTMLLVAPDVHAKYKEMKLEDGGSLAAKVKAYQYLANEFIARCYRISGL